jgi:hypothetical protein
MSKASTIQTSFNAGELSPTLDGRVDLAKYANGCSKMENFFPLVQGGARKRSGTRHVAEAKYNSSPSRLIPFEFGTTQAYILEFGEKYMRVYKNGGQVLTDVGGVYEIATPYPSSTLSAIQYAQSADVLFIAHPDWNPRKLTRSDHDEWTLAVVEFDYVPFEPTNIDTAVKVEASATTGNGITLTTSPSTAIFSDPLLVDGQFKLSEIIGSHHGVWEPRSDNTAYSGTMSAGITTVYFENNVYKLTNKHSNLKTGTSAPIHDTGTASDGQWDWEYLHSGEGYVTITAVAGDGFSATANVVKSLPDSVATALGTPTHRWAYGAWTGKNGYPRSVSFFEDRLWWAGTDNNPQTLWASKTSDYENHQVVDLDESALVFTLNTDQVNVIEWINAGKVLMIGTAGGEFVVAAALEGEALVPGNVRVVRHSTYGSKSLVTPQRVEQVLLFVQRAGRKLRELVFDDSSGSYMAPDMTVLADHITLGGITRLAWQQEPNRMVWAILGTGELICFTYDRAQQVTAWHRHPLGGTDVKVESIAVIPHPSGDQDQLWLVVSRTIGGGTKRQVELLEPEWVRSNPRDSAFFVDAGLSYEGEAATTMTGLLHLEGQTVAILAGGATHPDRVVSGGTITLDRPSTSVHAGLPYTATLQTMRLDGGGADGTSQGKTKRITNVVVRLDQTGAGFRYGPSAVDADMDEFYLRDSYDLMDEPVPLFDGDTPVLPWPEGYEQAARVTIRHTLPLPCTVTAIMPQFLTQDR